MSKRKFLSFILVLASVLCCITVSGGSVPTQAASISDLQSQLDAAKEESNRLKAEIAALEKQNAPYQERLAAIRKQITATENEIELYQQQISSTESKIDALEKKISDRQAEIAQTKRLLGERLAAIYKSNSNSTLVLLLSSENMADFLNKTELLRSITDHDREVLDSIAVEIEEINGSKAELNEQIAQLEKDKQVYADKQAELDKQYAEVNAIVKENEGDIHALESNKAAAEQRAKDIAAAIKKAEEDANRQNGTGVFTWPVPGYYRLSDPYGWRTCPYHGRELHAGADISQSGISGAKIVAADSGTVILSKYYGDYGNCVMIDHGNGYTTLYAHMKSRSTLKVGASVTKGQTVGYVGSTGASTGPHLHFEVRKNGTPIDPMQFF